MPSAVPQNLEIQEPVSLGRYRLTRVLSDAGAATVYQAVAPSGDAVALKWARRGRGNVQAIREEIALLQSIDHPGVVQVIDTGIARDRPWFAMPYIGRTAAHGSQDAFGCTLSVRQVRVLASTLGWLHAHGIVHRDLKPSNVMISEAGLPILVDFGVSVRSIESDMREVVESNRKGWTAQYAAPELYHHEGIDGRVDLYALGVMCPDEPRFAGVKNQLMAPIPDERPRYGCMVGERLEQLGAGPRPPHWPNDAPQLLRSAFVGRETELSSGQRWVDAGLREHGGVLLIRGPSGSGKTRLGREISTYARHSGAEVFAVACGHGRSGREGLSSGLVLFRPMIRQIADLAASGGSEAVTALFGEHLDVLSRVEPALRQLLPEGTQNRSLSNVSEALTRACLYVMDQWSQRMPSLLLVDDLQWADELSLRVLHRLAEYPDLVPNLSVACTLRSEAANAFESWTSLPRISTIDLHGLGTEDIRTLLRSSVSGILPVEVESEIIHHAAGSPLMANWLLDEARASARLFYERGAWRWLEGAPVMTGRSDTLLLSQLSILDADARALVCASSVLGRRTELHRAALVADLTIERARRASQQLVAVNLMAKSSSRELRFSHDKVVESVYRSLGAESRQRLHLRAAAAYEGTTLYAQLAFHYEEAERWVQALDNYLLSAQQAYGQGRHQAVFAVLERVRHLNQGRTLQNAPVETRLGLNVVETQSLILAGTIEALQSSAIGGLELLKIRVPSTTLQWVGRLGQQILGQLRLRWRQGRQGVPASAKNHSRMSHAAWFLYGLWWSAYNDATIGRLQFLATAFWVANLAERAKDWTTAARIGPALGLMYAAMGLTSASEAAYERSLRWAKASEQPQAIIRWNVWRLLTEVMTGNWDNVESRLDESTRLARHHSATQEMENLIVLRSLSLLFRGRLEEGMALCEHWMTLPEEFRFQINVGTSLTVRASFALLLEREEVALQAVDEIFQHYAQDPSMTLHAESGRLVQACLAAKRGEWETSFRLAEQVRKVIGAKSSRNYSAGMIQMFMPRLRVHHVANVTGQGRELLISRAREAIAEAMKDSRARVYSRGASLQAQAELSSVLGEVELAKTQAEQALEFTEQSGLELLSTQLREFLRTLDTSDPGGAASAKPAF